MKISIPTKAFGAFLALLLVSSAFAAGTASAETASGVNWGSDVAPSDYRGVGQATIATHQMEWGTSSQDALKYEDDSGDITKITGEVNKSYDNPYSFIATDINFSDADAFPHSKDGVSALDAAEWTTSGLSATDVETAPGVSALNLANTSLSSGQTASATFSNFSVTSDENKRYLTLFLDVNQLGSSAKAEFQVTDEDGDKKIAEINASRSSGEDYITNATGEGVVYQIQLGQLSTVTNGDGTFDNMQSVKVVAKDGPVDVTVSALNIEKTSPYTLGEQKKNTDDDDDLETVTITEHKQGGVIKVHSLSTLGQAFENAALHDLRVWVEKTGDDLADEDVKLVLEETGDKYPGYKGTATLYLRNVFETAYDLSWSNTKILDKQAFPEDRVISIEYAEAQGDTAFSDISDSAWTDKTSLYTAEGTNVTVDDTVQSGQQNVIKFKLKLTDTEFNNIPASASGGGGGGGGEASVLPSWLQGLKGMVVGTFTALLVAIGLVKRSG